MRKFYLNQNEIDGFLRDLYVRCILSTSKKNLKCGDLFYFLNDAFDKKQAIGW